jgi:hypothetical protein
MSKHLLVTSSIFFSLLMACTKDDEATLCGPHKVFDLSLREGYIVDNSVGAFHSYMEDNNRVFQWSGLVENVCPDEHVNVTCNVALFSPTSPVSARGRIDWLILFEKKITMTRSGDQFTGKGEAGLKQAFKDKPGSFSPVVEVFFPTKGSYSADTAFLKQHVYAVQLTADFWEFSP